LVGIGAGAGAGALAAGTEDTPGACLHSSGIEMTSQMEEVKIGSSGGKD
jgi:hypothetical protein